MAGTVSDSVANSVSAESRSLAGERYEAAALLKAIGATIFSRDGD